MRCLRAYSKTVHDTVEKKIVDKDLTIDFQEVYFAI